MARVPRQTPSDELFYEAEDGTRQDAEMHDDMLAGISPEDDLAETELAREAARAAGATDEQLDRLYPLPE